MKHFILTSALLVLAACASGPTPYQPAGSATSFGYVDRPIEKGRYQITYRGRNVTEARTLALRRAADLTVLDGGDWFQVTDSYVEEVGARRGGGSGITIGGSTGGYNSGVGVGIGFPLGGGGASSGTVEAGLEFVIGFGEKPNEPNAYDAQSVLETAIVN